MRTHAGFLISQIRQVSGRAFDKMLKEYGVDAFNGPQGRILSVLWEHGPMPISSIGKFTSLAKTTLTSMLERMEAQELIFRETNPKNKRQTIVSLTDEARKLEQDYEIVSDKVNEIFFEGFTEEEIRHFEDTLRRILHNYEKREYGEEPDAKHP